MSQPPAGIGSKTENDQETDTQGDDHEERFFSALEKTEGDSLVLDEGEVKKSVEERKTHPGSQEGLGKGFGQLIKQDHQAGQEEEDPAAYARRFFFSSSD